MENIKKRADRLDKNKGNNWGYGLLAIAIAAVIIAITPTEDFGKDMGAKTHSIIDIRN